MVNDRPSENFQRMQTEYPQEPLHRSLQKSLAFNISPADADSPKKTDPQSVPQNQQNPSPAKQSHHLRNFIIIFAIGAGLLIALAAAAK
jgi:hypothetical protein